MAIYTPESQNLKANIFLRNGFEYLGKDITPKPFGERETCVSFWEEGAIRVIPLDLVAYVDVYEDIEDGR